MDIEVRKFKIECRDDGNGAKSIQGIASTFYQPYPIQDFMEQVAVGAFDQELARKDLDVACQIEHQGGLSVIGRTTNGSLKLSQDSRGLIYNCIPAPTQAGKDILTLVAGGYIRESSFAFSIEEEEWDFEQSPPLRTIKRVKLFDVAPVSFGANSNCTVMARAKAESEKKPRANDKLSRFKEELKDLSKKYEEKPKQYKV